MAFESVFKTTKEKLMKTTLLTLATISSIISGTAYAEPNAERSYDEYMETRKPGYTQIFENFGSYNLVSCEQSEDIEKVEDYGFQFLSSDNYQLVYKKFGKEIGVYVDLYLDARGQFYAEIKEFETKMDLNTPVAAITTTKSTQISGEVHVLKSGQILLPGLGIATQITFAGKPALRLKLDRNTTTMDYADKSPVLQVKRIYYHENAAEQTCAAFGF